VELREPVARVRLHDADGDDLGAVTAPAPVAPGDVLALANGSLVEVVALIDLEAGDALCEVAPIDR
jgi:hypothetical protein